MGYLSYDERMRNLEPDERERVKISNSGKFTLMQILESYCRKSRKTEVPIGRTTGLLNMRTDDRMQTKNLQAE